MIPRWADYIITGVQYDRSGRDWENPRIAAVEVRMDLGGRFGSPEIWRRGQILNAIILDHETFVTASSGSDGVWVRGAHVRVIKALGVEYIRVDRAHEGKDDLGHLPEF